MLEFLSFFGVLAIWAILIALLAGIITLIDCIVETNQLVKKIYNKRKK